MKRIIVSLIMCISILPLRAGGDAVLEIAEDLYSRLAFTKAADYYQRYLEKNDDDIYAWQRLADCYDLVNDYDNLETTLAYLASQPEMATSDVFLDYAEILQIKGKFNEAGAYYEKYLAAVSDDRRAQNQLDVCRNDQGLFGPEQQIRYVISNMEFNTDAMEYSPNFFNNTLLYTSTTIDDNTSRVVHQWTGGTYSDLKQFELDSTEVFILYNEMDKLNTKYNDGPFTMDPITKQILYTRNNFDPDKSFKRKGLNQFNYMNLKIYMADNFMGEISNIREFPYNSPDYNTGHPTISADGKYMVFVSDKPDEAIGQRDLYYCSRDSIGWAEPVLLSSNINTEGDELFPYFHKDGTLYFSSDGLGSIGGLDIFRAEVDLANNQVYSVERLEDNINTTYDDFGIVFQNSRKGFFTSDRPGGNGRDDIYSFEDNTVLLKGIVVDAETGDPIPNSAIRVGDSKIDLLSGTTDANGRFETYVQRNMLYNLLADTDYYYEQSLELNTEKIKGNRPIEVTLELEPVKYKVTVMDAKTQKTIPGATVDIDFGCNKPSEQVITARGGSHDVPVYKECLYDLKAKADGYLAKNHTWTSSSEDKDENIIIYVDEITFEPIVLRNIYYDFDKADLRLEESIEDLNKVFMFLVDNPELSIQINSHTDSRGSKAYNVGLSQRRAQSVVNWLVAKRVLTDRLVAIGYGENSPVNECSDGVKCDEAQHQQNRRTELQVVNADGSTKIESDARTDIKIDPCTNCTP